MNSPEFTTSTEGHALDLSVAPRPDLAIVVFDFDGTLSWLRHGWPAMMCAAAAGYFPILPNESAEALRERMLDEIMALNGRPSIAQCERLAEMIRDRGGVSLDAESLRMDFQTRLDTAIERRTARIRGGEASAEDYLIAGAREFLQHVAVSGLMPVLLSSTVQERVEEEAALLGVKHFFGKHLYGGKGDPKLFSKRAIMEKLLAERSLSGTRLLSFGDGPAETRAATELGGIAVAVCTDEEQHASGRFDERKRTQLRDAGAHAALADFRDAPRVLRYLIGT